MSLIEIIFIGVGLSMDAFAVAVSSGLTMKKILFKNVFKIAICFGLFQAVMPLIGWFAASCFCDYLELVDGWIALILLGFIGIKMIYDGMSNKDNEKTDTTDYTSILSLMFLGIATSIDALMVGVTFVTSFNGYEIIAPIAIIGITTYIISSVGVYFGKKFGDLLGNKAQIAGGIILVLIGLKTFFL